MAFACAHPVEILGFGVWRIGRFRGFWDLEN
jgi:hypothetical protein